MFEDLALADFGNRIPSLTFEVFADAGAVAVGAIAGALTDGRIGGAGGTVDGYAASGSDVRAALQPLIEAQGLMLRADTLMLVAAGEAEGAVPRDRLAAKINGKAQVPVRASRDPAESVPVRLSLRHYDAARDYQAGIQNAVRPGAGRKAASVDVPATLGAAAGKALATERLAAAWAERSGLDLHCGWDALVHVPGSVVTVEGPVGQAVAGRWRIVESEWEAMGVRMTLRRVAGASIAGMPATAGSAVLQPDRLHGATQLMIADLPVLSDTLPTAPVVVVAAAGASAGWRRAALFSVDAGSGAAVAMGGTAPAAAMGRVIAPPAAGTSLFFDASAGLDVEMLAEDMILYGADDDALARGANLALVGAELIQFGSVVPTGLRSFRLGRLLRGRRGTEWAMAGHGPDEPFLMIDADRLAGVPAEVAHPGDTLRIIAIGIGDTVPAEAARVIAGAALMPLSPVHLRVDADGAGGRAIGWTRRSRAGWRWSDGVDAPLGEESERYAVRVLDGAAVVRSAETATPSWTYDAAMAAADAAAGHGSALTAEVRQVGAYAAGRVATIAL